MTTRREKTNKQKRKTKLRVKKVKKKERGAYPREAGKNRKINREERRDKEKKQNETPAAARS